MTEPDIVSTDTVEITTTTLIDNIVISRRGTPDAEGTPGWRLDMTLANLIERVGKQPIIENVPPIGYELKDLAFDPTVLQLYALLRDVTIRMARGDLKPLLVEPTSTSEA
jgi:hypothetical protein